MTFGGAVESVYLAFPVLIKLVLGVIGPKSGALGLGGLCGETSNFCKSRGAGGKGCGITAGQIPAPPTEEGAALV